MFAMSSMLKRVSISNIKTLKCSSKRYVTNLTPKQVTQVLSRNELRILQDHLPASVDYIDGNQLGSNQPIEDRIRISSFLLPGYREPTLVAGVFDGHGTGITADFVSRRLFNYIAIALHEDKTNIKLYDIEQLKKNIIDLNISPPPQRSDFFNVVESNALLSFKKKYAKLDNIEEILTTAFKSCDDDLSNEIQQNLLYPQAHKGILNYYLSAAVSGCCAIVILIHQGVSYIASTGDCRAIFGQTIKKVNEDKDQIIDQQLNDFEIEDLNSEHNCDNIDEIRRLESAHPKSEQNTIIKHNRLLGNLMPFRAFGDFNYKWSIDLIRNCGLTRAFGINVIPTNYKTPPYLIVKPEVKVLRPNHNITKEDKEDRSVSTRNDYIVLATDGLWEQFDSSRDVMQALREFESNQDLIDKNSATHILRSALQSGPNFEHRSSSKEDIEDSYHRRLESLLTLPQTVVRSFRDDISLIVLKLK